jgi:hypothetical protein
VVGDFDPNIVGKAGNVIKVIKWEDVENAGASSEVVTSVAPSQFFLPPVVSYWTLNSELARS